MAARADVAIVGAGVSGLAAYRKLKASGVNVQVFEKSRGSGGRMSTRRGDDFLADLGAQFTAGASQAWSRLLKSQGSLIAEVQVHAVDARHPRYVHTRGMSALTKMLMNESDGKPQDFRFSARVASMKRLEQSPSKTRVWEVSLESGEVILADALLVSAPLPQSLELLKRSQLKLSSDETEILGGIVYASCFALIVHLDPTRCPQSVLSKLPIWKFPSDAIDGIYDQKGKGLDCKVPTWVVHASASWSRARWEQSDDSVLASLMDELRNVIGSDSDGGVVRPGGLHRWKYCEPLKVLKAPYWETHFLEGEGSHPPLLLAGDAFGRSSVEGAFASGAAAGARLIELRSK